MPWKALFHLRRQQSFCSFPKPARYFSNVSHELKTPMTSMKVLADSLLHQDDVPAELYREFMQDIVEEIDRENRIISDLLQLVKIDNAHTGLSISQVNINKMLESALKVVRPLAEKKNIELEVDMQEDSAFICADEALMAHVWNNLLSNAIKFTPEGGTVILRQTSDVNEVRIVVSDTGCGMSEDVRKRIFDKFYQGDTSHATEGNGLGLALVKRIIELSNATISVESTPGKGSAFSVVFPAVKTEGGVDQ